MQKVKVLNKYNVYIGSGILKHIEKVIDLSNFSKVMVIADENVPTKFLGDFDRILISSGEKNKSIKSVQKIWEKMLDLGLDRKSLVINVGGGVIGDIGGFAASCFMRGIKFIQIPTTLLSAVDASIGGKVGINFRNVKNLIGSFDQPIAVFVDVDTFDSLPEREFISGFGEIIKHGVISDKEYFNWVSSKPSLEFSKDELIQIIKKSCEIKREIIKEDEKESNNRKLLNFGHTVGHGLESYSFGTDMPLLHGEAVGLGMLAEAKISKELGLIDEAEISSIKKALEIAGLPTRFTINSVEKINSLIEKDKKSEKGKISWTLIEGIGKATINNHVPLDLIVSGINFIS